MSARRPARMRATRGLRAAVVGLGLLAAVQLTAQTAGRSAQPTADPFEMQRMMKVATDHVFLEQLSPLMLVRKVSYRTDDGLTIPAYLFAPRDTTVRRPAIILVHGGVHADFNTAHLGPLRSLVADEGYVVIAPEYRGSTGYGRAFYDAIDYGGREVEDCIAARDWLAAHVPNADTSRMAIMGWSHGGFITLHALFRRPELFRAGVAHVPVADLPARMRTHPAWYREIFEAQPAFGGPVESNPAPYVARSPSANARRLTRPVLVHTADNDEDVFIVENHILRDSMHAAGKDAAGLYTYREFHDPPGGHSFGLLDTPQGRASWRETVAFLGRYLKGRE